MTSVQMRMRTISACIDSWPRCFSCIRACSTLHGRTAYIHYELTRQLADKPTCSQSSSGLVNSRTSQLADSEFF